MQLIPAIDLRHGKVVQLVGGDPNQVAVEDPLTPHDQAEAWKAAGADRLHVIDLDGAFGEANQWHILDRIKKADLPIQFGGGVRSMVQIQRLLELGVDQVIVGTQGVQEPAWLMELATLWPGKIILAVDARGRDVVVKGWTERTGLDVVELARSLDHVGLGGFLYTNVEKEGRLEGIDLPIVEDLRRATPNTRLIVSGGITNDDDLAALVGAGVDAVVLGMSIYTGKIDLKRAIEATA
ncbi:MAG: HisA/HisF-related TIM barrel protein [Thermoplasmatota archaeon]